MPAGQVNLKWIAARITEKQLAELTELVTARRIDPRQAKLEKKRDTLMAALRKLDAEVAVLTGEKPATKRPGRKPGKPAVKAIKSAKAPKAAKPGKATKANKPAANDPARAAMLERMAKARAARAAKLAAAQ